MTLGQVIYGNSCDLQIPPQSETNLKVIELFGELVGEKTSTDIYSCQECGCVLTFRSQQEADANVENTRMNSNRSYYMSPYARNGQPELQELQRLVIRVRSVTPIKSHNQRPVQGKMARYKDVS